MSQVPALISDPADIREIDCLLPADGRVSDVASALAEHFRFPLTGPDGFPLSYALIQRGGQALAPSSKLASISLPGPLRARLVPRITVGGEPDLFESADAPPLADPAPASEIIVREERTLLHDDGPHLRLDVRIDAAVHREIEHFAAVDPLSECAGLLLGHVFVEGRLRVVHVTAASFAADAPASRTSVEFSVGAWEAMLAERDTTYRDLRVLGWLHTHAGWGIFLSDSDVFLHSHFFPHPNMVAYVLDPTRERDGFFYWHNGVINPCTTYALVGTREQVDAYRRAGAKKGKRRVAVALGAVLTAAVCFGVAGPGLMKHEPAPRTKPAVRAVSTKPAPVEKERVYCLGKRDNLWIICKRVYGDGDLVDALARYNGISDFSGLQVGQEIRLPSKEALIRFSETRPLPTR